MESKHDFGPLGRCGVPDCPPPVLSDNCAIDILVPFIFENSIARLSEFTA